MKTRTSATNDGALLSNVAKSIGAALGTIAAKANAAQKSLTQSSMVRRVEREAKRFVRKRKRSARKSRNAVGAKLRRSKLARAGRPGGASRTLIDERSCSTQIKEFLWSLGPLA